MSADLTHPVVTDNYTALLQYLRDNQSALVQMLDGVTPVNLASGAKRWNSTSYKFEKFNGTVWGDLAASYAINISGSSSSWGTARTIAATGDVIGSWVVDGTGNVSSALTLKTMSGLTTGSYGGTTAIPVIAVDINGRITAISTASITIPVTSVFGRTGAVTLTSGDVTGALGFTPYNSTNPSGFITSGGSCAYASSAGSAGSASTAGSVGGVSSPTPTDSYSTLGCFVSGQTSYAAFLAGSTYAWSTIAGTLGLAGPGAGTWRCVCTGSSSFIFTFQRIA